MLSAKFFPLTFMDTAESFSNKDTLRVFFAFEKKKNTELRSDCRPEKIKLDAKHFRY